MIREVRRRQGLTQAQLAQRAGTSQPVISAYEHGRRDPGYEMLRKLVEAGRGAFTGGRRAPRPDLPPPDDVEEHARRLLDVLSLADAIRDANPTPVLHAPRLVSR